MIVSRETVKEKLTSGLKSLFLTIEITTMAINFTSCVSIKIDSLLFTCAFSEYWYFTLIAFLLFFKKCTLTNRFSEFGNRRQLKSIQVFRLTYRSVKILKFQRFAFIKFLNEAMLKENLQKWSREKTRLR